MKLPGWLKLFGPLIGVGVIYVISSLHVTRVNLASKDSTIGEGKRVIRLAHSMTEPQVQAAFRAMADAYEQEHPDVRIRIQSIPTRAYEQWIVTQLMGDMAPDVFQVLGRYGVWNNLALDHLQSLTVQIGEPNPYNDGGVLEGVAWRNSYVDEMEGGYFFHLMDYFAVPMSMDTTRIFYNLDLFREVFGHANPPSSFGEWMNMCEQISTWEKTQEHRVFPIAASAEDRVFFKKYFPTLTGGVMDKYDTGLWGLPSGGSTLYGLYTETFDLKQPALRAAFDLLQQVAGYFQPSFMSDQSEQRRMLFVQGRAAMVVGGTRDLGVFQKICPFEVGVFDFPQVDPSNPKYGSYYKGPARDQALTTFSFGISRNSQHPELALDFMRFVTAQKQNEQFCRELGWLPAIRDIDVSGTEWLDVFLPNIHGVIGFPVLFGSPSTRLYFDQYYPSFLGRQIQFETFMDGLAHVWLTDVPAEEEREIAGWIRAMRQTEYNISRSRVTMLFEEAGPLEYAHGKASRTPYQMGVEIVELLDSGNNFRQYVWEQLQVDNYPFPPSQPKVSHD